MGGGAPATNGNGTGVSPPVNDYGAGGVQDQQQAVKKFICKNNGVLFENDILQIGIKCEYRLNLGRVGIFFGNKTPIALMGFSTSVTLADSMTNKLTVQARPVDNSIDGGAQVQQTVNFEFVEEYNGMPDLAVSFMYSGVQQKLHLKLPVTTNKFIEPTEMNSEAFFARWKNLSSPAQEAQKIFKATLPMDGSVGPRLAGFGMQLLEGVDPNPENYVCAGIVHGRGAQIGSLLRLEPNKQASMYRLTIRSSKDKTSQILCDLLVDQF